MVLLGAIAMLANSPAFAYLDPGTGSMVVQAVIASIAIGMATMRMWWYRVKAVFSKSPEDAELDSGVSDQEAQDARDA